MIHNSEEEYVSDADEVVPSVEAFVDSGAFTSPDECLFDDDPFASRPLLPPPQTWRGKLIIKRGAAIEEARGVSTIEPYFSRRVPTVRFFSAFAELPPSNWMDERKCSNDLTVRVERIVRHTVTLGCMQRSGVRPSKNDSLFNLHWGARLKDDSDFSKLLAFQRINHFPGTWVLGRKDTLAKHLRKASQRCKGQGFESVAPPTYSIPVDLPLIQRDARSKHIFIAKPPARARGEGIFLFSGQVPPLLTEVLEAKSPKPDDNDAEDDDGFVVQRYISNPLLINGYKVDLRVYVVCTSFDPLRLYVYNEGLVRFASQPYPTSDEMLHTTLRDTFRHLTNFSINKKSASYVAGDKEDGGCKWSLHALKRYFAMQGWPWDATWKRVVDVIIKSFIAVESTVCAKASAARYRFNCFELYGFDIMLDRNLDAHLIEVNVMPSLACGAAIDKHVKGHMIADLLTLVGLPIVEKSSVQKDDELAREAKRCGLTVDETTKEECNLTAKPAKFDGKKWATGLLYFSSHATLDDKVLLRDTEEELRRCGGFSRVMPTASSEATYGAMFETSRHYNKLLWTWESWKLTSSEAERQAALLWLKDEGPFPSRLVKAATARKASVPRVASLSGPRRSASARCPVERPVALPPIDKRSVPVSVFTFLPVNGRPL
ncbi:Hypothetical protein, putative [Bodo saltans]|uniref:Tubulin--tyrosine ligase-like protein 5 n=1 Tax=Bodo saltans TaxID=75058 RepID=A0A0S4KQK8_BODSA|nr:Hypothetical protein, putative [Bodo saltans]|eukprot:CUI15229.1 Hypothetical protein, putative [Bodo saltans]